MIHIAQAHGRYSVEWGDPERAILELDYLRADRGEITAEVSATSTAPAGGVVHVARVNLLSTRSLSEYAAHVVKRTSGSSTDWGQLVGIAAREVVTRYRRGEPAILLRDVTPSPDAGYILPPLAVARMPTILFGDGGAGKSLIALAMAASIQSGDPYLGIVPATTATVGYLDWEMDGHEHRGRLARLAGDDLPGIVYVPMARPLADDVDRIRREIIRHEIGYLVVDSVGLACDGPPEAAEVAIRFFGALRELGLGSLLVAHVNRSGDTSRPFGSAFFHNSGRLTWYAKVEAESPDSTTIALVCKKANTGARPSPLGFRVDWGDRIAISQVGISPVADLATHVAAKARIAAELRNGALTIHELVTALGLGESTVRKALERAEGQTFVRVTGPDQIYRWGLTA